MQREAIEIQIGLLSLRLRHRPPKVPPGHAEARGDSQAGPTAQPLAASHVCAQDDSLVKGKTQGAAIPGTTVTKALPAASDNGASLLKPSDCLLGWELWPAAWRLATFVSSGRGAQIVREASAIIELGAGLGLPGLVAAKVGARAVTLTDLPQALELLAENIRLNGAQHACRAAVLDWAELAGTTGAPAAQQATEAANSSTGVAHGAVGSSEGQEAGGGGRDGAGGALRGRSAGEHVGAYDVVLAADVVYVSSMAALLADTIAAVCRANSAVVLVGHTIRKSVWLDRATGQVRVDEADEPWELFKERMTRVHGFRHVVASAATQRGEEGVAAAAAAEGAAAGPIGTGTDAGLPPDTFVSVFERVNESVSPTGSG